MRRFSFIGVMLMVIIGLPVGSRDASGGIVSVVKSPAEDAPLRQDAASISTFRSSVSQKNLLGLDRETPFALPKTSLSADQARVIRVCGIRVQFEIEDPDDPLTTGDGHFDLRDQEQFALEELHQIDMAPHSNAYFRAHFRALNGYWKTVSNGRIELTYDVYPQSDDSVYTLNEPISYYGSRSPFIGLADFFQDALELADLDDDIDFSQWDAFIIFHAGADQQMNLSFSDTDTPYDLFSGFIVVDNAHLAIVDDGAVKLREAVLMPETVSQDNRVIALNGVLAHEFGHQLGLVDLYDSRTFMTQIGDFSLMDNQGRGTTAQITFELPDSTLVTRFVFDPLPVYPDAWSRAYLGFADVVEIADDVDNFFIRAAEHLTTDPQVVKVPISDLEYFLLENRQFDSDQDGGSNLLPDSLTGVILGPAPADTSGPRVLTRDYDFFVPGAGLLIYHVDETRSYLDYNLNGFNNFDDNSLQWYNFYPCLLPNTLGVCIDSIPWENRRFISIVEADGIIDFGGNYRTGYGSQEDFFFRGNNSVLGPTTNPSSKSLSGASTGIEISGISAPGVVMGFDVRFNSRLDGFPKFVDFAKQPPILADYDSDGADEIFTAGSDYIIGMEQDGSPIIRPTAETLVLDSVYVRYGDTLAGGGFVVDTLRSVGQLPPGNPVSPPLVLDWDMNGVSDVIVLTDSGYLAVRELTDDGTGSAPELATAYTPVAVSDVVAGPVSLIAGGGEPWIIWSAGGSLYRYNAPDEITSYQNVAASHFAVDGSAGVLFYIDDPGFGIKTLLAFDTDEQFTEVAEIGAVDIEGFTAADLDGEHGMDFALTTSDGYLIILKSESEALNEYSRVEVSVSDSLAGSIITASLDPLVAEYQIILCGDNTIHVYNHLGIPFENFPQPLDVHKPAGLIMTAPLVSDVDGNGIPDIVVSTGAGEVFAVNANGVPAAGFPMFAGSFGNVGSAIVSGLPANNFAGKIFTMGTDNRLYGLRIRSQTLEPEQTWRTYARGAEASNLRQRSDLSPLQAAGGIIVNFYNWPNPAKDFTNIRYTLTDPGSITIQVYDMSGRLVYEARETGGETSNDHIWNLDGFPSGVYICRLEAESNGITESKTHKIAVVK